MQRRNMNMLVRQERRIARDDGTNVTLHARDERTDLNELHARDEQTILRARIARRDERHVARPERTVPYRNLRRD